MSGLALSKDLNHFSCHTPLRLSHYRSLASLKPSSSSAVKMQAPGHLAYSALLLISSGGWNSFIQRKDTGSHVFSGQASPLGSYRPGAAQALGTLLFPWVLFLCTQISAFLRTSPLQMTETDHLVSQVSWGCRNRS